MARLRFIVVGLGARAQYWLRLLKESPDCEVVGMVDPARELHARAQAWWPAAATSTDLTLLAKNVEADIILLCTPPHGRREQMEIACASKLAILAEKPLADTLELARTYVKMAAQAAVPLVVGLNFRYLPVTLETKRLLKEKLGRCEFARFTYERWRDGMLPHLNKYPLTMAQPMLWEQSIHHFDLMRFLYEAEPIRVFARSFNPSWSMYADDANVSAIFEFDTGLIVNYQGTWQSSWREHRFELRSECADGLILQRSEYGELSFAQRDAPSLSPVPLPTYEQWVDDMRLMLRDFVEGHRGGIPFSCTGLDHLKSLQMVEACVRSSRRREAVSFAELL